MPNAFCWVNAYHSKVEYGKSLAREWSDIGVVNLYA